MRQTSKSITVFIILYSKSIAVALHWHTVTAKYDQNAIVSAYVNSMRICAKNT